MERVYPATDASGKYYLYDDNGKGVTNQATLRALAEGWETINAWRKRMEIFEREDEHED